MTFVYHTFDDPFEADRTGNPLAADFDYAITCCEGSLQHYARMGTPAICLYPPYDEEIHGNAHPEEEFDCDFSLVATNLYPKSRFPKVLVERSQLARLMVGMGSARFYGPWDKRHGWGGEFGVPDLKSHWHGFLKFDRLAALFVSTKINVNTHVRPDGYRYLNERTCLLLGAGAFMMCDRVAGLEEWSDNERRFVLFSSLDEFVEKARYYLDRPKERAEIAARGQAFAEDRFSSTAFARDLCRFVGRPMEPARTEPTTTAPSLDHPPSAAVSGG
ncbi:MAG: glycosyltransferase [Pseudomonadota bacterium]